MRNHHSQRMTASSARVTGLITRNPRESVALIAAAGAAGIIFVNALFLQAGPHPAPIFAHKAAPTAKPAAAVAPSWSPAAAVPAPASRPDAAPRKVSTKSPATPPPHNDPIAQLLAPSNRMLTVQRVLTEYGYGQIRPTGIVGPDTEEAIRKFERSRKLPVSGAMSDQLVRALADMSGRPID